MILETQRLVITELTIQDTPFFFELVNDEDWKRFIGDRNINTLKDAEDYLTEKMIPSYKKWGFGFYLVSEKDSGTPLGISGFVDRESLDFIDVGFAFLPIGRRKGYGYESTKALIEYGKQNLQLDTLLAIANKDNVRSHLLLKKLGFRFSKHTTLYDEDEEICLFTNQKFI
ncbi:MAG: GNAT family N-acetyltransferase [Flavobacteriaceae bacterium]